jgi:hypothetical protein
MAVSEEISQGEQKDAGQVTVASGQDRLHMTLQWPGSSLRLAVVDPQGRAVDENYTGAIWNHEKANLDLTVLNPLPGNWSLAIVGEDVPEGTCGYTLRAITYAPEGGGGAPWLFLGFGLLAGGALALGLLNNRQRRPIQQRGPRQKQYDGQPALLKLCVVAGPQMGRVYSIGPSGGTIGRQPGSAVLLDDPKVSRLHARLAVTPGGVWLEDCHSTNGTRVNGQRVTRHLLRRGDGIQIGATQFKVG